VLLRQRGWLQCICFGTISRCRLIHIHRTDRSCCVFVWVLVSPSKFSSYNLFLQFDLLMPCVSYLMTSIPSWVSWWLVAPCFVHWWLARDWSRGKQALGILHRRKWRGGSCLEHHRKPLHHVHSLDRPPPSLGVLGDISSSRLSQCTLRTRWCRCLYPSALWSKNHHLGRGWSPPFYWRRLWLHPDPTLSCSPPPPPSSVCLWRRLQSPGQCCSGWSVQGCWAGLSGFFPPGRWCDRETPKDGDRLYLGQESPQWQLGGHKRVRVYGRWPAWWWSSTKYWMSAGIINVRRAG